MKQCLCLPAQYMNMEQDEKMYVDGGVAPVVIVAAYKIAAFTVVNWSKISTIGTFANNVLSLIGMVNSWRQRNGTYYLKSCFVRGGTGNIFPPHSYQGATGYWTYYSEWKPN